MRARDRAAGAAAMVCKMQPLAERRSGNQSSDTRSYRKLRAYPPALAGEHQDWNVSRQVVWGIPTAWNKGEEWKVVVESPGEGWIRTRILLTPGFFGPVAFITLGFPDSKTLRPSPTDVMETGADLIFFWVARMLMLGLYAPDSAVYITCTCTAWCARLKGKNEQVRATSSPRSPCRRSTEPTPCAWGCDWATPRHRP